MSTWYKISYYNTIQKSNQIEERDYLHEIVKLCEHSKHEPWQRNVPPKKHSTWNMNKIPIKTAPNEISRLEKCLTRIDQSAHEDSVQLLVGLGNQRWMHQVQMKWEIFRWLWFPQEIGALEEIYRMKLFSVFRSLKADFCIK